MVETGDEPIEREAEPGDRGRAGLIEFAVLSAGMLFWEICLIRWISTEIRVFAYYKNLSLLAAFLGFGVGLLSSQRQDGWFRACFVRLAILITFVTVYPYTFLRIESAPAFFQEFTWHPSIATFGVTFKFYTVILGLFLLNAAVFVPWGRRIGYHFERLPAIPAYSINVAANLVGIALYSALSTVGAPPIVWVLVGMLPLVALRVRSLRRERLAVASIALALVVTGAAQVTGTLETHWSPYYKITIVPPMSPPEYVPYRSLEVNHDYHQRMLDLRPEFVRAHEQVGDWERSYGLPYRVGEAGNVLVVGAGTGNDVASALRHGASHVVAVEIDPTILAIGRRLHPERPYDSPKVEVRLSDARTYLRAPPSGERFDVIVFGLLDSHTQVSGMTSLRLDNFVYTRESFAQARDLLDPNKGLLAVSFSSGWGESAWTIRRIYRMLTDVFGRPPRVAPTGYDAGISFLTGPAVEGHPFFETDEYKQMEAAALERLDADKAAAEVPATDDWPFLYLQHKAVPLETWIMGALLAAISAVWVLGARGRAATTGFSLHFFFLGAAFLLIEVRNLVAFSLLYGSTWKVNNVAIAGILLMILAANLIASRARRLNPHFLYALLFAALLVGLFVGPDRFRALGPGVERIVVPLLLSLPVFCAGLVFIRSFAESAHPAAVLGANLLGGICGGLLENVSLALGIESLQVLALLLYLLSYIALIRERSASEKETAPTRRAEVSSARELDGHAT